MEKPQFTPEEKKQRWKVPGWITPRVEPLVTPTHREHTGVQTRGKKAGVQTRGKKAGVQTRGKKAGVQTRGEKAGVQGG